MRVARRAPFGRGAGLRVQARGCRARSVPEAEGCSPPRIRSSPYCTTPPGQLSSKLKQTDTPARQDACTSRAEREKSTNASMKTCLAIVCALGLALSSAFAATFQNLDFDSATTNITLSLPPDQGVGYGPASDLLPGWQLFQGTDPVSLVGYDLNPISLPDASIYDANSQGFPAPVSGRYSLGLYPGYNALFEYEPLSLVQTGDIGANVQSIRFINYGSPFELRVNGTLIPLRYEFQLAGTNLDTRLANVVGDVSAFAGQTVQLKFTTVDVAGRDGDGLDGIGLAPPAAPEPAE